jgi:heat shock protein HslJ
MKPTPRRPRSLHTTPAAGRGGPSTTAVAALLLLVAASTQACASPDAAGGATGNDRASTAPTTAELAGATYAGIFGEPVTLTGGRWEGAPYVEGGAARPSAGLVEDFLLEGDIDGDGREDAAVLLWESSGGSGTRTYLAAVGRNERGVVNLGTALVGDRVQVKQGSLADGRIVLDLLQAGPGDAACCPTQKALVEWRLVDGVLTRTGSEITGTLSLADLEGTEWVLAAIGRAKPVPDEPQASLRFDGDKVTGNGGCNSYFGTVTGDAPGHLEFGAMGATKKMCPEPGNDLERRFLRALAGGSTYGFVAGRLVIDCETDDGPVSLIFRRRAAAATPTDPGS